MTEVKEDGEPYGRKYGEKSPDNNRDTERFRSGRRRRRPSLWDVKEPPYGVPMAPPGSSLSSGGTGGGTQAPPVQSNEMYGRDYRASNYSQMHASRQRNMPYQSRHSIQNANYSARKSPGMSYNNQAILRPPSNGYVPGPNDVVHAPGPDEHGPLAGIDVVALRALLSPRGIMHTNSLNAAASNGSITTGLLGSTVSGSSQGNGIAMTANAVQGAQGHSEVALGSPLHATRHARRLYVGNLPADTSEAQVSDFFNRALTKAKGVESEGNPIISVYINLDKRFAFIETRTVGEAAAALALDGVLFRGMSLRMRRPNDYNPDTGPPAQPPAGFDPSILGIVSTQVSDGPNKVFVGGIPYHLTEDQIKELLQSYGRLAAFNLIKEPNTGMSKGFAFFEYADPSVMDAACEGLNGMQVGDKVLTVRKASAHPTQNSGLGGRTAPRTAPLAGAVPSTPGSALVRQATKVLELRNVVTEDELKDDEEYSEIKEEMEEEGRKFGLLKEVVIPRPNAENNAKGVGRIFLLYSETQETERAFAAMSGRKFDQRTVIANYFSEERFQNKDF